MKVLLINSPSKYSAYVTSEWDRTAEDIGAFPPIGLSYIAGYLKEHTNHEVSILDALALKLSYDEIAQKIREFNPDVAGTTLFTPTFYDHLKIAKLVKSVKPNCIFCVGGTQHLRMFLNETLSHPEIDYAIRGEGEIIFSNLLNVLDTNGSLSSVSGISYVKDGSVVSIGDEGYIDNINKMPSPAFDLLPINEYKSAIGTGLPVGTIATSRGCPYSCTFCDHPYRTYRSYDQDRILSEMSFFYDRGIKEFVFFDDMFNISPKRVIKIAIHIRERFPDIIWSFRGRADQVSEEMLKTSRQAGLVQIMFGIEAARDIDLKAINKQITLKQLFDSILLCHNYGIEVSTNWIIGLPTHRSKKDVLHVLKTAIKSGTDFCQFNILIPYAGTDIFKEGVNKGILPEFFWNEYTLNPIPNAYIPAWDEFLSRDELSGLLKTCYRRFYFRPINILKSLQRLKSFKHFLNQFRGMLTIIGFGGFSRQKSTYIDEK